MFSKHVPMSLSLIHIYAHGGRVAFACNGEEFATGHFRHTLVGNDDMHLFFREQFQCIRTGGREQHIHVPTEARLECFQVAFLIIHEEDTDPIVSHGVQARCCARFTCRKGRVMVNEVPTPGWLSTATVPPRSLMMP